MARTAAVERARTRQALKAGMRVGKPVLDDDRKRRLGWAAGIAALCALSSFATYRLLNDDYEVAFERNLRHMANNVVACVQSKRLVNATGPVPVCVDPANASQVGVDVAVLPPAAARPEVAKAADAGPAAVKPTAVAAARPKPSPLLMRKLKGAEFRMPEREGPMPAFRPVESARAATPVPTKPKG